MKQISQLLKIITESKSNNSTFRQFIERNYADAPENVRTRYENLLKIHRRTFGDQPAAIIRAPGRIELLGGHTDYNGCPVIPMAIDKDIVVAASKRTDRKIVIQSVEPRFPKREFIIERQISSFPAGDWGNYVKAAVQGLVDHYGQKNHPTKTFAGFNLTVSGNIPAAAGLSSSSALVVVSALTFLHINSLQFKKLALAQLLAQAEKYVGTQGGGMDQTISLLGRANQVLKIEFNPYAITEIPLPPDFQIVAAHSLVYAPKTESAMDKYNRRAIECRLATALINHYFKRTFQREFQILLIGDLTEEKTGLADKEILGHCQTALIEKIYTYQTVAGILELDIAAVQQKYCLRRDQSVFPEPADGFKLYARFYHIFTEWKRVLMAAGKLTEGNLIEFGRLMNESQASSRDNYELSIPEIDQLVSLSRKNGSLAARLSGAGFGGITLHLMRKSQTQQFIEQLRDEYYRGSAQTLLPNREAWHDFIFTCQSADGAGVVLD